MKQEADGNCGSVNLSDQDDDTNVCIMAKALVFARTGGSGYRNDVVSAIDQISNMGRYNGRALALGRELGAYVIAADLIDLKNFDPKRDSAFRSKLQELRTTYTDGGPDNLIDCHEKRPNNWGQHVRILARGGRRLSGGSARARSHCSGLQGISWGSDLVCRLQVRLGPFLAVRSGQARGHQSEGVHQRRAQVRRHHARRPAPGWILSHRCLASTAGELCVGSLGRCSRAGGSSYTTRGTTVWNWQDQALFRAVRWLARREQLPGVG